MSDEPTEDSSWVHFAPFGSWKGHEEGAFKLDKHVFDSIIARFDEVANDIQVDYNHDSVKGGLSGPKPAAGWIKALEVRGNGSKPEDGLWGLVEWTKRAAAFIRNREYRYTSPVIDFKSKDRKTGKVEGPELFNAALTNDPFLDGQVPLALERLQLQMEIKIKDQKVSAPVAASEQEPANAAEMQEDMGGGGVVDKIAAAVGMEPAAVEAVLLEKMDDIVALVAGASEGDGTPADETMASDQPAAAVANDKWSKAQTDQRQLNLDRLSKRVDELEADKRHALEAKVSEHVSAKIESGEIPDQNRKLAEELYLEDWDRADKIFCSKVVPINERQSTRVMSRGDHKSAKLTEMEQECVTGLVACGYSKDKAIERIVAQRKVN